ncbi:MAG: hypothetical protein DIU61_009030 [Bacteroidota bacterium]|jgi:hypothetical protein
MKSYQRALFAAFAFINLVAGVLAGFGRLGLSFPLSHAVIHHGAIMVGGFLGTLISLEKVIPLKRKALLIIPVVSALSIIPFSSDMLPVGAGLLLAASAGLAGVYLTYLSRQRALHLYVMFGGAICWVIGNGVLFHGRFFPAAFPWWMGFLLFTIVGERLELSKFLPVSSRARAILFAFMALVVAGLIVPFHEYGSYIAGVGMAGIAVWLMRFDMVGISIRKEGLTRFIGYALMSGYCALMLEGVFLLSLPDVPFAYDIIVHTFFLGFVFSMIFAHGPIILPGVLGVAVKPYHPLLYLPLVLLVSSVVLRILAGMNVLPYEFRITSAWMTASAMILYFVTLVSMLIYASRKKPV